MKRKLDNLAAIIVTAGIFAQIGLTLTTILLSNSQPLIRPGYASMTPFDDGALNDICSPVGSIYGEPTALASDDGNQIDLWFSNGITPAYCYSTNGSSFTGFANTDISAGYLRPHILKVATTYYLYVTGSSDTDVHLFTGTNKVNFTDQGQVLALGAGGQWDDTNIGNTFVWKENTSDWYMLYEARSSGSYKIGLATATAAAGPWTKYGSNPVFAPAFAVGNPELPRIRSTVLKYNGRYYMYYHGALLDGTPGRAYSTDLHTWTNEGAIDGIRYDHLPKWNGSTGYSYGDHCLVQFKGKTYLFWSPSNQVDSSHIDGSVDDRIEEQLLAAPVGGAYAAGDVNITN